MRSIPLRLLLAFLLALTGATPGLAAEVDERINAIVLSVMKREAIPGAAVVVLKGNRPIFERSWGNGRMQEPQQPLYSVSKQMTAAVVLKLVEQGKLELEAPVGRYLPRWFADEPALKVRHLLRHTSGLADFVALPAVVKLSHAKPGTGSLNAMAALIDRLPRRFLPGERHAYSNSNYTLLALIAERVAGRRFDALQRSLLFEPLGLMTLSGCAGRVPESLVAGANPGGSTVTFPRNSYPAYAGNGGNCGSVSDLARWTRALATGRVVPQPLLGEMLRGVPVRGGYVPPYGFGLSRLDLAGRRAFSHAGVDDGWSAWAGYLPEEDLTLAITTTRGWLWTTEIALPILRALLDEAEPPELVRLPVDVSERAALHGAWEDGLFDIDIAAEADRIVLAVSAFPEPIELWKQEDGRFVSPRWRDTFALRIARHGPEFDWAEHRSYPVRRD